MILLDTNFLIGALVKDSQEASFVKKWYHIDHLASSSVAWYEFMCGPIDAHASVVIRSLIHDRILPWTSDQAAEAARLYNSTGRIRRLRIDAMIAAAAIVYNADLATANLEDFKPFVPFGLKLLELS